MIRDELHSAAIRAIHRLTLMGRMWAFEEQPPSRLAKLLDDTEYLLALMYSPEDESDIFIKYLEGTTTDHGWPGIYERFAEQVELAAV